MTPSTTISGEFEAFNDALPRTKKSPPPFAEEFKLTSSPAAFPLSMS